MNGFLEKKKFSLIAAKVLLEQSLYASSVHCSFYGCLQALLHVLFVKLKYDKNKFDLDLKFKSMGTQQYVAELIQKHIKKKHFADYLWFNENFKNLKDLRVLADYSDQAISQTDANIAISKAAAINNLIDKIP